MVGLLLLQFQFVNNLLKGAKLWSSEIFLGCSHTTARIKLQEAINELSISHGNNAAQVSELAVRLNRLDNQIHLLDHRKSEAEKNLAKIEKQKYRASDQANKVVNRG